MSGLNAGEMFVANQKAVVERVIARMNELPVGTELDEHQINEACDAFEYVIIDFECQMLAERNALMRLAFTTPLAA